MSRKSAFVIPLLLLTLLNLFWAFRLQLYADEAYYWMYSQRLDWGYFDHPPMVALLIRIGYDLVGGEAGVRLLFVILTTASYALLYLLAKPQTPRHFWLTAMSLFPLHLLGFMALPDMPLFFFAILFFLCYRRYLANESFLNALLLALTIAGMLYSKYHGILIVFFTLLSNPRLFRRSSFYLVVGMSLFFYLPHIWWQAANDFVSLRFHLLGRVSSGFKAGHILNYLVSFFLFNGPFIFVVLTALAVTRNTSNAFDRALKFNLAGFFIFFLVSAIRGRVEANWTLPVLIPALVLGYQYLRTGVIYQVVAGASLVLILSFRCYLLFPQGTNRALEFHGHDAFAREVRAKSEGLPIVATRYQEASLLSFYLSQRVPTYSADSRKSQFDLWDDLRQHAGRPVVIIERVKDPPGDVYHPYFGWYNLKKRHLEVAF